MKAYKLSISALLALAMVLTTSCESYFGDINADPDEPIEVTPDVLLTQVELRLAYTVWGDLSRFNSVHDGQIDGTGRQFAVFNDYGIRGSDVDACWSNLYTGIMMDNRRMASIAQEEGSNWYLGISQAIEAYTIMMVTDYWGDVPYSEALQGNDGSNVNQPAFDSQEDIYNAIFALIDEARGNLGGDVGARMPGADDLIYSGSATDWILFLNVLEARGKLHLGKVASSNYDDALSAIAKGGLSADATVGFGTGATEQAPWFQYLDQRDDIDLGGAYIALIDTTNLSDPRVAVYGTPLDAGVAHPVFTADRAAPLLTKTEELFIIAEATFQSSGAGAAANEALKNAVANSFADAGLTDSFDVYWTATDPGAGSETLELIMTEKYKAMFCDPEVFNDWRRTGFPTLSPKAGGEIPRRLPYAETEVFSNTNTPSNADVTIFSTVWWDK